MKKLLLTLLLLSSFSFACDLPHEEIAGIKIGCPLSEQGYPNQESININNLGFFDYGNINQSNDHATNLTITKEYVVTNNDLSTVMPLVNSDLKVILQELSSRWGVLDIGSGMSQLLNMGDFSKIGQIGIFTEANIDNISSRTVNKVTAYIYREKPSERDPSPSIYINVFYSFFDQSKRAEIKGI